jgi:pantoate--beta-alanine ligase
LVLGGERRAGALVGEMRKLIEAEPRARIDYIEAVDAASLTPVVLLNARTLIALAVWIGAARLIDNLVVEFSGDQVTIEL